MKNRVLYIVGLVMALSLQSAIANDAPNLARKAAVDENRILTLSPKQINQSLNTRFPIRKQINGYDVSFHSPSIALDFLDKTIKVNSAVTVKQGEYSLEATALIKGDVDYDEIDNHLYIEYPSVETIKATHSTFPDNKAPLSTAKISMGSKLPEIIIFDFSTLDIEYLLKRPKRIDVAQKGLVVYF
ncbi:hypothetical protein OE749_05280 [Aestuariibacter sp. AA17]|uniref:Uncharacterized protein n=1 Tax=Fluctibacter corallii TaxID=2984329 RepID=A0ABT3A5Y6_9ALTE|nr:hypothetical protein [Aestuariibacter sp. AA17]MCV2884097.1 hypothetical protein [Aestuariibacter sp. AA17]